MSEKKIIRKIRPFTREWEALANDVARSRCPPIYPCQHCARPVADGYCCGYCGTDNPGSAKDWDV